MPHPASSIEGAAGWSPGPGGWRTCSESPTNLGWSTVCMTGSGSSVDWADRSRHDHPNSGRPPAGRFVAGVSRPAPPVVSTARVAGSATQRPDHGRGSLDLFEANGSFHRGITRGHLTRVLLDRSRGVAQSGSAPALGAGGRRFESGRPDWTCRIHGFWRAQSTAVNAWRWWPGSASQATMLRRS